MVLVRDVQAAPSSLVGRPCYESGENMDWRSSVNSDPAVCHGQACIRGTRIPVSVVMDNVVAGVTAEQFVEGYPSCFVLHLVPPRHADCEALCAFTARRRSMIVSGD
jgi:uncharacterized protein (DUF433 family)